MTNPNDLTNVGLESKKGRRNPRKRDTEWAEKFWRDKDGKFSKKQNRKMSATQIQKVREYQAW